MFLTTRVVVLVVTLITGQVFQKGSVDAINEPQQSTRPQAICSSNFLV
jgi:hypothetical protein